jgi:hypothetical protein
MKTKLVSLFIALAGLNINAASAEATAVSGDVGTKFTSDYHRRGQEVSNNAVQAQVGVNVALGEIDLFGDFFTNQGTDGGSVDSNEVTLGVGSSFLEDRLSAYAGVYNTDASTSEADLEAFFSIGVNTLLSPTINFYRDTSDNFNTFEGQLSHTVDLKVLDFGVAGALGNTELTEALDSTYFATTLTASKTFNDNLNVYADVSFSDTDSRDYETLWGLGLSVKF